MTHISLKHANMVVSAGSYGEHDIDEIHFEKEKITFIATRESAYCCVLISLNNGTLIKIRGFDNLKEANKFLHGNSLKRKNKV